MYRSHIYQTNIRLEFHQDQVLKHPERLTIFYCKSSQVWLSHNFLSTFQTISTLGGSIVNRGLMNQSEPSITTNQELTGIKTGIVVSNCNTKISHEEELVNGAPSNQNQSRTGVQEEMLSSFQ